MKATKEQKRKRKHKTIRKRVVGTAERPRVCVNRSLKNLFVQVINDVESKTIFSFSTSDKEFKASASKENKVTQSEKLGEFFGKKLQEKGVKKVTFDRAGYLYHGRVKALAESLRKSGIEF